MKINTNLTPVFNKYKGLWVALDSSLKKVISADKNAEKAYKEALEKGYKKPTLFKVPQENLPYFGFVK
jgi:maltose-binding protein MalE